MLLRLITIYLLTINCFLYADNTNNGSTNNNTIIVVGDSLSAAYGIETEEGWVNLLRNKIHQQYSTQWNIVNASISGDTTAGGVQRLANLIQDYSPQICIIALGANDGLRGLSLSAMKNNIEIMIKQCNNGGQTLLVGMKLPPNYGEKYSRAFHSIYSNLAQQNSLAFVPFMLEGIALEEKYFQADLLHPTAAAQPIILKNIWYTLQKIL